MPTATYLRTICTVPVSLGANISDMALWERVFLGWQFRPLRDAEGYLTDAVERAIQLVTRADQSDVRSGALVYALWPQSSGTLPALVNLSSDARFVTVRIFAATLTDVQAMTERVLARMARETAFEVGEGLRVALAISIGGVRTDLTSGRVNAGHGSVLTGFYAANKYVLNITVSVLVCTLLVVLLVTPNGAYTPLGKMYGLAERVLSAVLLNFLLLASQFLFFARHHPVIAWERP
ncbi:hypothetical protein MF271_19815 (plasmid) [Deinococcus sp. KNUC1210]|uniref:hypothetical protein n=1 Tax=Deinococcus sp. KNUC1210 TaxID=2917691 RepID=UPI001EF0125B|nr:hypothetical protein [Deinococcus sp. KNUC1210]ULH17662.1 hypothetical protein MF271_19815 [Deinococcus sp. KNUC1210]